MNPLTLTLVAVAALAAPAASSAAVTTAEQAGYVATFWARQNFDDLAAASAPPYRTTAAWSTVTRNNPVWSYWRVAVLVSNRYPDPVLYNQYDRVYLHVRSSDAYTTIQRACPNWLGFDPNCGPPANW